MVGSGVRMESAQAPSRIFPAGGSKRAKGYDNGASTAAGVGVGRDDEDEDDDDDRVGLDAAVFLAERVVVMATIDGCTEGDMFRIWNASSQYWYVSSHFNTDSGLSPVWAQTE
jgi:hypothetical protein